MFSTNFIHLYFKGLKRDQSWADKLTVEQRSLILQGILDTDIISDDLINPEPTPENQPNDQPEDQPNRAADDNEVVKQDQNAQENHIEAPAIQESPDAPAVNEGAGNLPAADDHKDSAAQRIKSDHEEV